MRRPATWPITITPGRTYRGSFKAPFNCVGYEFYASCCDPENGVKLFDFDIEWVNQIEGLFSIVASKTTTTLLTKNAVWDLLVVQPNGESFDMLEGPVRLDPFCTVEPTP